MSKRPNLNPYFNSRIDLHVNGMFARSLARLPADVERVVGDVDAARIVAIMKDGTEYAWAGGRYAARKINGCYAPLMPKPIKE